MLTSLNIADEYMKTSDELAAAKKELERAQKRSRGLKRARGQQTVLLHSTNGKRTLSGSGVFPFLCFQKEKCDIISLLWQMK